MIDDLFAEVRQHGENEIALLKKANTLLNGQKILITDKNFNGQPCGRSWPKLEGKIFEIRQVIIDRGQLLVHFDGAKNYTYMPLSYGRLITG